MKYANSVNAELKDFDFFNVGRLGAQVSSKTTTNTNAILLAALDMAERRILRLERAIQFAGINLATIELPE